MAVRAQQDQWEMLNVSRETLDRLQIYADLLEKWQKKINLVSNSTIPDLWTRHMLDSAQVYPHLPEGCNVLADIGCGAGFPGLVLGIMGVPQVHLIDSDTRKMAFCREVARAVEVDVVIHNCRIEAVKDKGFADVVTSRALATLDKLLTFAQPLRKKDAPCVLLKGRSYQAEIDDALNSWDFDCRAESSLSDPEGKVLIIERMVQKNG